MAIIYSENNEIIKKHKIWPVASNDIEWQEGKNRSVIYEVIGTADIQNPTKVYLYRTRNESYLLFLKALYEDFKRKGVAIPNTVINFSDFTAENTLQMYKSYLTLLNAGYDYKWSEIVDLENHSMFAIADLLAKDFLNIMPSELDESKALLHTTKPQRVFNHQVLEGIEEIKLQLKKN